MVRLVPLLLPAACSGTAPGEGDGPPSLPVTGPEALVRPWAPGPAPGLPPTDEGFWMAEFSWVIPDALAGMAEPGRYASLEDDLAFLEEQGIDLLVSLTLEPADPEALAAHGIEPLHVPVEDMTAPTQDQLDTFVLAARPRVAAGEQVGVHCTAGLGRTGTVLATYLVTEGRTSDEAIDEVRSLRPGSIETEEQEEAVHTFYARWLAGEVPA